MQLTMAMVVFFGILLAVFLQCNTGLGYDDALGKHIKAQMLKRTSNVDSFDEILKKEYVPVYVAPQDGLKEGDKVGSLPGQPSNAVPFDQYSGYVTVDPTAGRALFYYFAESPQNSSSLPLVLWLNGGPGCSSFGNGAMMELGPFRVKNDGLTLSLNQYAWNNVANIIFLESPAGVGFSYSNTTSDYKLSGDKKTAEDSYVFLVNWLERFPEYKTRDFFIAGESYAGHYAPQLAKLILHNNKSTNQTVINLKGIAIGNAWVDYETGNTGSYEYFWTHALISDETYSGIVKNCNFTSRNATEDFEACMKNIDDAFDATAAVFIYNIYAPFCTPSSPPPSTGFDPCSGNYISSYLNSPAVQNALHANVTSIPYPWSSCSEQIGIDWNDSPDTVLSVIQELMASGISVWMYSGDTDGRVPVTSTRQSINKMGPPVKTKWYPWYASEDEVGGYAIEYQNLTLVTMRGAGHFVPSYQPASAIAMFSSFLQGNLPPTNDHGI